MTARQQENQRTLARIKAKREAREAARKQSKQVATLHTKAAAEIGRKAPLLMKPAPAPVAAIPTPPMDPERLHVTVKGLKAIILQRFPGLKHMADATRAELEMVATADQTAAEQAMISLAPRWRERYHARVDKWKAGESASAQAIRTQRNGEKTD